MFLQGRGLNSSYAIFQDATGKAFDRVIALGIAVGSGYLFETNFKKEVFSDLTGERGTLMGCIQVFLQLNTMYCAPMATHHLRHLTKLWKS